uniref:Uncharacterized protein n=1 Tax=Kalanchoe fedtschenkoi TaxID=63787 RepID=A0A7N1A660_KALFE
MVMNQTDRIVIGVIVAGGLAWSAYVACKGAYAWLRHQQELARREAEEMERLVRSCKSHISNIRAATDRILSRQAQLREQREASEDAESEDERVN